MYRKLPLIRLYSLSLKQTHLYSFQHKSRKKFINGSNVLGESVENSSGGICVEKSHSSSQNRGEHVVVEFNGGPHSDLDEHEGPHKCNEHAAEYQDPIDDQRVLSIEQSVVNDCPVVQRSLKFHILSFSFLRCPEIGTNISIILYILGDCAHFTTFNEYCYIISVICIKNRRILCCPEINQESSK